MNIPGQVLDLFSQNKLQKFKQFHDDTMSPDQLDAAKRIMQALAIGQDSCLMGSAGTGKTYVASRIAKQLHEQGVITTACAPTHKAAGVLAGNLHRVQVFTVHALMGLVPKVIDGEHKLLKTEPKIDEHTEVLIVDEVSMIDAELFRHIMAAARTFSFNVIFIGDAYQLPPTTSEKISPVFSDNMLVHATLTKIHRQAEGSRIITLATAVRDSIINGDELPGLKKFKGRGIKIQSLDKWSKRAAKDYKNHRNVNDIKMIAYTNTRVLASAYTLRRIRDGHETRRPVVGEKFVANDTVLDANERDEILIPNNTTCKFVSVEDNEVEGIKGWRCEVVIPGGDNVEVFMPEEIESVKSRLQIIASRAVQYRNEGKYGDARDSWANYFYLKNSCADLRPTYAQTIHKSQGSGYERVYMDLRDIAVMARYKPEVFPRALYTAITRAREKLYIVGAIK